MAYNPANPMIVQGDFSVLLEAYHPDFEIVRSGLSAFADLEKSPEHIHTYRITPLSLWNAAATGQTAAQVLEFLLAYVKFPLPNNVCRDIEGYMSRYGLVKLMSYPPMIAEHEADKLAVPGEFLYLYSQDIPTIMTIAGHKETKTIFTAKLDEHTLVIPAGKRGIIKQLLVKIGYPVEDLAGYVDGEELAITLRQKDLAGREFALRDYQRQAVELFYDSGRETGGSGVLVLPCGAGKTIIGIGAMEKIGMNTLILTTSTSAVHQWMREIVEKTDLPSEVVGEYSGDRKDICPVTVTTYQMVTYRPVKNGPFPHFEIFNARAWGLVIYDEVHTLPAPVFQVTAELQAKRRLGLTATLVREDGKEADVFTLIGPKKLDVPWIEMESAGWIATAVCTEVRVPMDFSLRMECAQVPERIAYRMEAENVDKLKAIEYILHKHAGEGILIIGQYIKQLEAIADYFGFPLITGKMASVKRDELYQAFRSRKIPVLIVSKVANFAIDLPDAAVGVQVSGAFGSRQEEAQRLGRILRPKDDGRSAYFYSVVSKDSREQEFAHHRQLFLTEQGYQYQILDFDETLAREGMGNFAK
ncbi:DNA repair helicase XPB [Pelosinus propionicus]|uniref:DNA 3'-5' helicase n=1 Tax=Pelosinus propionicus DSM 13327 TaxID=1123291 RepID=A0A1I4L4F1_9FIRM|nr:DNA repair helicase XPB [Pelosinus propionicus]SFL85918.1 DNA excision repair protein ERCC-3 [Pelosinus propionicus DSM 13327]